MTGPEARFVRSIEHGKPDAAAARAVQDFKARLDDIAAGLLNLPHTATIGQAARQVLDRLASGQRGMH